jgi:hypothetical protein
MVKSRADSNTDQCPIGDVDSCEDSDVLTLVPSNADDAISDCKNDLVLEIPRGEMPIHTVCQTGESIEELRNATCKDVVLESRPSAAELSLESCGTNLLTKATRQKTRCQ